MIIIAVACCAGAEVRAADLEVIGVKLLQSVAGDLNGAGIRVAQTEASLSPNSPAFQVNPGVVGQPTNLFTFISGLGSSSTFPNAAGEESAHANRVAQDFYGFPGGVAPSVAHVDNFDADYFWSSIVALGSPPNINARIVNQSFVFEELSPAHLRTIDSQYDNYAAKYNTLFVSGAGNAGTVRAPATCYNGIGVGAYGGRSSLGPTPDNGRAKPDITAPAGDTSFSTPQVAGAAALLLQAGLRGDAGGNTKSAGDIRTVKALLLNGAVKTSDWTNTAGSPFDPRYGAGVLNVFNSYEQLIGGKQGYSSSKRVPTGSVHPPLQSSHALSSLSGWDFNVISSTGASDGVNHYYFHLSNSVVDASFTATATLVWNRHPGEAGINNLDLFLYDANSGELILSSTSAADNTEHVFRPQLTPGRYDLQVLKRGGASVSSAETYALACEFALVSTNTGSLQVTLSPAAAAGAGADWRVDGGIWQSSGTTLSGLSIGNHTVTFKSLSGWIKPANQRVVVGADHTTTATGTYVSPFLSRAAKYSGLFYDTNGLSQQSSGLATISTTRNGKFTGKVQMAGRSYPLAGRLSDSGWWSNAVPRKNSPPLLVRLQMDLTHGEVFMGQISDGTWVAELVANRATFHSATNPAPQSGRYTLVIPGGEGISTQPGGDGYGGLSVVPAGNIAFSGALSDGTKVSQKTFLSKEGRWPFYVSLYSGQGLILGWITFSNEPNRDIQGSVSWIKPQDSGAKLYPAGFVHEAEVVGSVLSNATPLLNFATGAILLENGDLPGIPAILVLVSGNRITGPNKLSLSLSASSGLFKGSLQNPADGSKVFLSGAILQKQHAGYGYFPGIHESGRVVLGP